MLSTRDKEGHYIKIKGSIQEGKTVKNKYAPNTGAPQYIRQMLSSVQFSSVAQSCPTLWDPMDCSTPGLPVHQQLLEFIQTHVHRVGDAIQPSHPLSSPSSPAPNPSQHQGLFQWVNSSHQVAKVLEFQLQHQSFQWTPRTDPLQDGLVGSPCSPRDSQSLIQHHSLKASIFWCSAFFTVQLSHPYMTTGKTIALNRRTFVSKVMSLLFNMLSRWVIENKFMVTKGEGVVRDKLRVWY